MEVTMIKTIDNYIPKTTDNFINREENTDSKSTNSSWLSAFVLLYNLARRRGGDSRLFIP